MFILRRITSENQEINQVLGSKYNLIVKEFQELEFKRALKTLMKIEHDEDIIAFAVFNEGSSFVPIYKKSTYFVMTSDGNTFDNLRRLK